MTLGLFMHGSPDALTGIMVPLGLGAIAVVSATILAVVALARGRGGRVGAIVELVLGVLSIPAGVLAGFFGIIFASGGAHGRPLRVGATARKTPTTRGHAWSEGGPEPDTRGMSAPLRRTLAEAWLGDAALEHASVAAFGALSLDLVALGAPPSLVRRSHEAASTR